MSKLHKAWWIVVFALASLFVRMVAAFFIEEDVYVSLPVYIGIMILLLFGIFAVFKWAPTK